MLTKYKTLTKYKMLTKYKTLTKYKMLTNLVLPVLFYLIKDTFDLIFVYLYPMGI